MTMKIAAAGTIVLVIMAAGDAAASQCLNQRQFRATEHKVRLRPGCWRAVAAASRRTTPAAAPAARPVVVAELRQPAAPATPPAPADLPYVIGTLERAPDPDVIMPVWRPSPARLEPARAAPPPDAREAAWWRLGAGAVILGLIAAGAWLAARRWGRGILIEPEPIDPQLVPQVIGAGPKIRVSRDPNWPAEAARRLQQGGA